MKKVHLILVVLTITVKSFAQSPEKISYQAVVRDVSNLLITNETTPVRISILKDMNAVYVETHTPNTNKNGLFSIEIGGGSIESGLMSSIDWSTGIYFVKTEIDVDNNGSYDITSASQLLSVPYALHAKTASNSFSGNYEDLKNRPLIDTYKVGDFKLGGVVFWVDETGQHGLICAKDDQSSTYKWGFDSQNEYGFFDGVYTGKKNTLYHVSKRGFGGYSTGPMPSDYAYFAYQTCYRLTITEGGVPYADWYLPSKYELNLIYNNRAIIDETAIANGGSALTNQKYWSSTRNSSGTAAWLHSFYSGVQSVSSKNSANKVRAIRSF